MTVSVWTSFKKFDQAYAIKFGVSTILTMRILLKQNEMQLASKCNNDVNLCVLNQATFHFIPLPSALENSTIQAIIWIQVVWQNKIFRKKCDWIFFFTLWYSVTVPYFNWWHQSKLFSIFIYLVQIEFLSKFRYICWNRSFIIELQTLTVRMWALCIFKRLFLFDIICKFSSHLLDNKIILLSIILLS